MLTSLVCKYEHFRSDWYARWSHALGYPPAVEILETGGSHRKVWEWCAISQALEERGMLQPGKVGLGFAVGQEPLSSAFAARGVRVLATDRPQEGDPDGWSATGQHAASLDVLFKENLIGKREFDDRVTFAPADMTNKAYPPASGDPICSGAAAARRDRTYSEHTVWFARRICPIFPARWSSFQTPLPG